MTTEKEKLWIDLENRKRDVTSEYERQISDITPKIKYLKAEVIFERLGVKIGSIVKDKQGNLFKVCELATEYYSYGSTDISVYGHPMKKDGTCGTARRYAGSVGIGGWNTTTVVTP